MGTPVGPTGHKNNPGWSAETWIKNIEKDDDTAVALLRDLKAQAAGTNAAVKALAESRGLNGDEMTVIVSQAVANELAACEARLGELRTGEEA